MYGKESKVFHDQKKILKDVPNPLQEVIKPEFINWEEISDIKKTVDKIIKI
ncbi:MAG: hypothetical protein ACTSR8_18680 [Promethearchaeota archaeon]